MAMNFPANPTTGETVTGPNGAVWEWDGAKWVPIPVSAAVPIAFVFMGRPASDVMLNVPVILNATIAANLAGTVGYQNTIATAAATFTLNRIRAGASTAFGTIVFGPTGITLAGAGGAVAPGDVLQMMAPVTQDATMADVGITIPVMRL